MKKPLSSMFLTATIISGLILISMPHFGIVRASTNVTGILPSDTTWTKANSPYILTGNVLVSNGFTLTIEAGATVNLGSYYIMVNGTLRARGSTTDKIQFNGGSIRFTQYGSNWSEAASSGSMIENANLTSTSVIIDGISPKIASSSISEVTLTNSLSIIFNDKINSISINGSPQILNNTINNVTFINGSPQISYNNFTGNVGVSGGVFSYNIVLGRTYASSSAEVLYNTLMGGVDTGSNGSPLISHNVISGGLSVSGNQPIVSYNTIVGGIRDSASAITILNNTISGSTIGIEVVVTAYFGVTATIVNNTITARNIGISIPESWSNSFYAWWTSATISGNTIYNCSDAAIQVAGPLYGSGTTSNVVQILNNYLFGNTYAIKTGGISRIEGNTVFNNYVGIDRFGANQGSVINNMVVNNTYGITISGGLVEGNLIANNYYGLTGGSDIRNNTIVNNNVGVLGFSTLVYNNIYGNTVNLNYSSSIDGNASYNWWETTNTATINQTIYDYKNDFTLGRVNFIPMLTAPNPAAPSADTPIPPVIPEFQTLTMFAILVTTSLLIVAGCQRRKKT